VNLVLPASELARGQAWMCHPFKVVERSFSVPTWSVASGQYVTLDVCFRQIDQVIAPS
jgi:hypothetical protein